MLVDLLARKFVDQTASKGKQRQQYGRIASVTGIISNSLLAAVKIVVGILTSSIAILGNGLDNLFDSLSSLIAMISFKVSSRPADKEHPYGHARFEYISSTLVAVIILSVGLSLLVQSTQKIFHPEDLSMTLRVLIIMLLSIVVKVWQYFFYKKIGVRIRSNLILAVAKDSLSDVVSTSAVVISLSLHYFFGINLDGYFGVLVAFFILKNGIDVLKTAYNHIMGTGPDETFVKEIEKKFLSYDGILGLHDLVIHDYGPGKKFVTAHLEVDAAEDALVSHALIDRVEREVEEEEGVDVTIHMDPLNLHDPRTNRLKQQTLTLIQRLDPRYSIHDFRLIGENLVFDVLVPVDDELADFAIEEKIRALFQAESLDYHLVLNIDRDYLNA